jgi:NAD(P)-dependent dehydrogenase (short-subunit alcohol dehydrogenase family)
VHVCDVDQKALRALAKSDPKATRSRCDVSDRRQVARLFKEALAELKGLDVLVNNAGIAGPTGKVDEIAPKSGTAVSRSTSPGSSTARGSRCRICARAATPRS